MENANIRGRTGSQNTDIMTNNKQTLLGIKRQASLGILGIILLLTVACGGGSDDVTPTPTNTPTITPTPTQTPTPTDTPTPTPTATRPAT